MRLLDSLARRFGYVKRADAAGWQAAVLSRLTQSWTTSTLSADAEIRKDLSKLRARSRDLCNNNDYARKFLAMLRINVLGDSGIGMRSRVLEPDRVKRTSLVPDKVANQKIEDAWWRWTQAKNCSVTRRLTWADIQSIALGAAATDGEVLIRKVVGFPNDFGFALQIIESDHLDIEHNVASKNGANEIRMGIELDQWRQPVAYWLTKRNPNDSYYGLVYDSKHVRIPASDIVHLYLSNRGDQTRGVPWMSTAMTRMNMLGGYEEAEVTASRAAACKMAFLTATGDAEYVGETGDSGRYMEAEPGALERLPQGLDIKTVDWQHPNSQYQVFMKTALRGVASGLGVSYNSLGNDMEAVNFASGKLGLFEEREFWKTTQRWFADHFCQPVFDDWLRMALTTGQIGLPLAKFDKYNAVEWRGRRWSYIDPSKEVSAQIESLNSGLTSISRILSEQNLDRDELFSEIAEDKAAAEQYGLEFARIEKPQPPPVDNSDNAV